MKFIIFRHEHQEEKYNYYYEWKETLINFLGNCEIRYFNNNPINYYKLLDFNVKKEDGIILFNEIDYFIFFFSLTKNHYEEEVKNFLIENEYVFFFSEIFINEKLQTIGYPKEDNKVSRFLLSNSKFNIMCDKQNINLLEQNQIYHNLYFPSYGFKEYQLTPKDRTIDIIFYGNFSKGYNYRNNLLEKLKIEYEDRLKIYNANLFGERKNRVIQKTKIVLHIPIIENQRTIPWAKIIHLINFKVFFIIEECQEIYNMNLEDQFVFYKNYDDLVEKINYYLKNKEERKRIIESNYNFINKNFDLRKLLNRIA